MQGRTQVAYNGSFGISTVYKNLKMLSGDEFRSVASERGISILDKGNNTNFQKEIQQTGLQQNHHVAFYGGSSTSSYRVSLGFMDRQGVILNEDMKNFTSNMNMNQKMFDGFFDCELGMFGSILKIIIWLTIRKPSIRRQPLTRRILTIKIPLLTRGTASLPPVR